MMLAILSFVAALAVAQPAAPQAEIRNVRISSPKLTVSRAKSGSSANICGQIHVDMSFAKDAVKKPVLRLVCLCDVGGSLVAHGIFLDRPKVCEGMSRSEIAEAFKNAGVTVPFKERDKYYSDPAQFTPYLSEATKTAYASAVYGSADLSRGFFRLGKSETLPKVILFRIEVWQNGVLVASHDSSRTGLGKYEIPSDWHVWKKYPQKFRYMDIR